MPEQGAEAPQEAQEATQNTTDDASTEPQGDGAKTFDADYVRQLRAEAAKYRKEAQEAKSKAQEYEDRDKTELEKLNGKLSKAEQAKLDAEQRLLRYEVAAEKQVPAEALELLTGSTREELEAKADKLLALVQKPEPTPDFDGGARETAPAAQTPEQAHDAFIAGLISGKSP